MRLKNILTTVLRPMNLDYSVQPGFIWISSAERIKSKTFEVLETRYYDIDRDVFYALFDADAEMVTNFILPDSANPNEAAPIVHSGDFPFLPDFIDSVTGETLSYETYNILAKRLVAYNSPTNLDKFEAHLLETGEKILAEE
jgi:hypothetical protein